MRLFCTDLDNTLIYSYRHDIGRDKRPVEIYEGREVSFMTERSIRLLQKINKKMTIVPVSTRTVEQYNRLDLLIGSVKFALCCNGGILLVDGKKDEDWLLESKAMTEPAMPALKEAVSILEKEKSRSLDVRFPEELFLFTKCHEAHRVVKTLEREFADAPVDIFRNKEKVYVLPRRLSKGEAIKRLRTRLAPEEIIAAGDSEFDISMIKEADTGYFKLFSDELLLRVLY